MGTHLEPKCASKFPMVSGSFIILIPPNELPKLYGDVKDIFCDKQPEKT